jgi:hypothetical protein
VCVLCVCAVWVKLKPLRPRKLKILPKKEEQWGRGKGKSRGWRKLKKSQRIHKLEIQNWLQGTCIESRSSNCVRIRKHAERAYQNEMPYQKGVQLLKQQFRIFNPATYSEEYFEAFKESSRGLPRARALEEFSKLKLLAWGGNIAKSIVCLHCFDIRHSNTTYAKEHLAVHCVWCPDAMRTSLANSASKNVMRGGQVKRKSLQVQQLSDRTSNFECTLQPLWDSSILVCLFANYSDSAEEDNFEYKCPICSTLQGSSLTRFFDRASKANQVNDIDQAIADWLFSTGLPTLHRPLSGQFAVVTRSKYSRRPAIQPAKSSTWGQSQPLKQSCATKWQVCNLSGSRQIRWLQNESSSCTKTYSSINAWSLLGSTNVLVRFTSSGRAEAKMVWLLREHFSRFPLSEFDSICTIG